MKLPRHIHIIGICGVATSALASALHEAGVKVTGSDKGFFPPASTQLQKLGISFYAGWHPEKMIDGGIPDLVVTSTFSGTKNPETLYAEEHKIPMMGYMEVFSTYFIRKNSIVCTGTWGKTSSSALLSYIFEQAGLKPTYMFGGISLSHEASAKLSDSDWSVFEGDEYKSSPTDLRPKFFHYNPTHLLLTAVSWDHADLYPTEESYFDVFNKLISRIPSTGVIVACTDNAGVQKVISSIPGASQTRIVTYGAKAEHNPDFLYKNIKETSKGISFEIDHEGRKYEVKSNLLGGFQADNITGCFAMSTACGIDPTQTLEAIAEFKGIKRRLQKRLDAEDSSKGVTIIDDIAHSPEKASSVLQSLRKVYSGSIVAIFEPNIGGRKSEAAEMYGNAFSAADRVIIPRLTKLKVSDDDSTQPIEGPQLADIISRTHSNTSCIEDDSALVESIISNAKKGDVIAFLGSHGFRSMIEETIERMK